MPRTVANSGSASVDGILASGAGQARRSGRCSTDSAISRMPGKRHPPPVSTTPADAQLEHSGVAQIVAQHLKQFAGARLEDFPHHSLRNQPRRPVPDRRHLDFIAFRDQRDDGVAVEPLDLFRLGHGSAESHREIAGEVIAAHRNHSSVGHRAFLKDDDAGGSRSQVRQAHAQFALVGAQHGVGAGQGLEHRVVHMHAGAIYRRDHVLQGAGRHRDHVHAHFEPRGHHAQRIIHPGLIVENELLRQQVQNFAIVGKRNGASLVHRRREALRGQSRAPARRS